MEHFLKTATDKLTTYKTPKKVIDYIKLNIIIGNPPYIKDKKIITSIQK